MITKELLASITPKVTRYMKILVKSDNSADYRRLKKLFDDKKFEAKSFEDAELDIFDFDWQSEERDRNWWWQLQALPFLNWYSNSFSLQTEEERTGYFSDCLKAIYCWVDRAKENKESPLVWHDHAAAFRVRNLSNWLLFCHSEGLPVSRSHRIESLGSLIIEHLNWLQDDKNYSRYTNHGFDQAMIVYTIGLMFDRDVFEVYRESGRERLRDEIYFAFTEDGVHKENSPGYQKMMLGRLKQLRSLALLGEKDVSNLGESYVEKAEAFLRAITLPNGYLPMIGDTRGGDKGLGVGEVPDRGHCVYDYSSSGYLIIKGRINGENAYCLIVKCCHDSNYHRHDDDLMIHFSVDGETVLCDGGLGSHDEKSLKRKHLRSVHAHSVPIVNRKFTRDKSKLSGSPKLWCDLKKKKIYGLSKAFGVKIVREIDFSKLDEGVLLVNDSCGKELVQSNWVVGGRTMVLLEDRVQVLYPKFLLNLVCSSDVPKKVICGWNVGSSESSSVVSSKYGQYSAGSRVLFGGSDNMNETKLIIDFGGRDFNVRRG